MGWALALPGSPAEDHGLGAWRAFIEAHAAVLRHLERELLEAHGLPLTHFDVLVQLAEAEMGTSQQGGLRIQELAERVVLTGSGVSRLVDRMQAVGLVDRTPCPSDRRGTVVVLTQAGRDVLRSAGPAHAAGIREHFTRHLTDEECAVLDRALSKVLHAEQGPHAGGC